MRVNLTVNESLVQYIQPGFTADIRPVGYGDRVLHGAVERVNQYAEPTGWRQANVKEYKAYIQIDDVASDLRSGMTASVTIHCADVPDAIQVPVQAIYSHGPKYYCFVHGQDGWTAREVKAGPTNDKFFVVESGLNEGEQVALNPRAYVASVSLPKLPPEEIQRAVPQPPSAERTAQNAKPSGGPGAGVAAGRPTGGGAGAAAQVLNGRPGGPGGGPGRARRPGAAPGEGSAPVNASAAEQTRTATKTSPGAAE
jgi:hypothetical protein